MGIPSEDISSLQRCVSDLAALTTLPALWMGYTPQAIAEGLSDVLLSILHLDLVYVRLKGVDSGADRAGRTIEIARTPERLYRAEQATDIGVRLDIGQALGSSAPVRSITNPLGSGTLWIATMPIGHEEMRNIVVAGIQSPGSLTDTDLLLLRAAANQAAIALLQAQLLMDLKTANDQKDVLLAQEQSSRREAERALQVRDEFLAVASHELKTPLTSLRGFVQFLLRQVDKHGIVETEQLQRSLERINQQSVKLNQLISQLLDLSRIESQRLTLELESTDITVLVTSVANILQKNTERHSITVQTPPVLFALADSLRLEQVMVNLIDNAIKYSPNGGPIEIRVSMADAQTAQISVADRGLGIPLDRRQHIFDRFYQAHSDGFRGGMGLGLYISRQIVELHAGTLEAKFPDEGGTQFIVFLPIGVLADNVG